MSEMVFKKVDYTLGNLIAYVEQGDIGLPEIQRPFVWPDVKVRDIADIPLAISFSGRTVCRIMGALFR